MKTKISKNKVKNLIKSVSNARYGAFCDETECIQTDYETVNRIEITYANDDFYICSYSVQNKPDQKMFAKNQKIALECVGAILPNFLKLRNNF
jgi:hypothetical protein